MLIEEFKSCIHPNIRTHLDERKIELLGEAAMAADDYALTHKLSFTSISKPSPSKPGPGGSTKLGQSPLHSTPVNTKSLDNKSGTKVSQGSGDRQSTGPTCHYCKKPGHIMSECFSLKRKEAKNKHSGFISAAKKPTYDLDAKKVSEVHLDLKGITSDVLDGYSPSCLKVLCPL